MEIKGGLLNDMWSFVKEIFKSWIHNLLVVIVALVFFVSFVVVSNCGNYFILTLYIFSNVKLDRDRNNFILTILRFVIIFTKVKLDRDGNNFILTVLRFLYNFSWIQNFSFRKKKNFRSVKNYIETIIFLNLDP